MKNSFFDLLKINLGSEIMEYIMDDDVIELYVNDDKKVYIDRLSSGREWTGEYMETDKALNIIYLVANHSGKEVTIKKPMISVELPEGKAVFEGVIPPLLENPVFTIRKYREERREIKCLF